MTTSKNLHYTSALILLLFFNLFALNTNAQRELWGTGKPIGSGITSGYEQYSNTSGWIYKTDENGENIEIVHQFDTILGNGRRPISELLLASNNKLYGTTNRGGAGNSNSGVLFEYDLALDMFKVVKSFTGGNPQEYTTNPMSSNTRLIEIQPGLIIGGFSGGIFAYDFVSDIIYNFSPAPASKSFNNIFKTSNGNLYAALSGYVDCFSGVQPSNPSYEKVDPLTGNLTTLFLNPCLEGIISSDFIEKNGKLYSTVSAFGSNLGIISSFDMNTNTYQEIYNFQGGLLGEKPAPTMIEDITGSFYGTTEKGGLNDKGILFKFNPTTNQFEKKYDFNNTNAKNIWLQQSQSGKLYGTTINGVFEYDISSETFTTTSYIPNANLNPLIEICRKPFYKYSDSTSFDLCEGTPFELEVKCTNSETIIWRQDGVIITEFDSLQIAFDSITVSQSGTWQVEFINECGSTLGPAINLTVTPSNSNTTISTISPDSLVEICPTGSVVLNGNNGGVWNTGENTASITVSNPGVYQVVNTNTCGLFYSNFVIVDTLFIPRPIISTTSSHLCMYDSIVISSSIPGNWNTGDSAISITVPAEPNVPYYMWSQNECRTDTSNVIILEPWMFNPYEPVPEITNSSLSYQICSGDSILLTSNVSSNYNYYSYHWIRFDGTSNYPANGSVSSSNNIPSIYVKQQGAYFLKQQNMCGEYKYTDTIYVSVDQPLTSPIIQPIYPLANLCEGNTIQLKTFTTGGVWNTGNVADTINVSQDGTYYYSITNTCGTVNSNPLIYDFIENDVSFTLPTTSVCVAGGHTTIQLSGGFPTGGYYSGQGVAGNMFNTSLANSGTNTLTYTRTTSQCSFSATADITLDTVPPNAPPIYYNVIGSGSSITVLSDEEITLCNNEDVIISVDPWLDGSWNNGNNSTTLIFPPADQYYFTIENGCGLAHSPTLELNFASSPNISFEITPSTFCKNDSSVILDNITPIGGIFSGNGIIGNQFTPSIAGVGSHLITYTVTDTTGCSSSTSVSVNVSDLPTTPSISLVNSEFCKNNGSVILDNISPTGGVFSGSGITGNQFNPAIAGIGSHLISYTVTNASGCSNSATTPVYVFGLPDISIIQQGATLTAVSGYTYQWLDCDNNFAEINGATQEVFTPTQNGNYAVMITSSEGCKDTSMCININSVGINEIWDTKLVEVYPNPAKDEINVLSEAEITSIRVLDLQGKELLHTKGKKVTVSKLANGAYIVEIKTTQGIVTKKFIKN